MRLMAPCQGIDFRTSDVFGAPLQLSDYMGQRVLLSFFRDAACPFCNFRLYELTHAYKAWKAQGLEIIAVFSSSADEVKAHVARYPRPFRMIADPELSLYNQYGVEHSASALLKALLFKMPRIVRGIATGGRPRPNPHVRLVPADFMLQEDGRIAEIWYGRDTSDHIPLARVDAFARQAVNPPRRRPTVLVGPGALPPVLAASQRRFWLQRIAEQHWSAAPKLRGPRAADCAVEMK